MQLDLNQRNEAIGRTEHTERAERGPYRVRVPFLPDNMGLGDAIASLTRVVGVQPCGGCKQRQEQLNKVQLSPWGT